MAKRVLAGLEPNLVWEIFEDITKVPRQSCREENIRSWVKQWAGERGIHVKGDSTGNLLLRRGASPGYEHYPTLVLQAHMDMVCHKKTDLQFDFEKDPIKVSIEGEYVRAEGTTLGADNGLGMAYALAALISEDLKHGPLEVVFTVSEETGFGGAYGMKPGFFSGKYLLNVDSENLGDITISSAGGGDTIFTVPVKAEKYGDWEAVTITVDNLKSGHSGVEIHLPRLNAIKVVQAGISDLQRVMEVLLACFEGGAAMNVIPAFSKSVVLVPDAKLNAAMKTLERWKSKTVQEAQQNEPNIKIVISKSGESQAYSAEESGMILELISEIPHGPISFSKEIDGLVQTSNNLAIVKSNPASVVISVSSRSSVSSELEDLRRRLRSLGEKRGATVELKPDYPGWVANPETPFVKLIKSTYEEVLRREVTLSAVHAGLECGLFSKLNPELQIASIGPGIQNAHSPEERVHIESVAMVWEVIRRLIESMDKLSGN